jgi:polyferredoxin
MTRYDLLRSRLLRAALTSRWPLLLIRAVALGGLVFIIIAAWVGTPVGSRNFGIIAVWIGWWALLMLVAVPLLGRAWCSVCPIPMPGEWLQQGGVLGPSHARKRRWSLGRRWPKALQNTWLQNGAFVLVALFSIVVLTDPRVTAAVLALLLLAAVVTAMVFERRAFCRHLCPVSGFIGLYSQLAPVELRVKDTDLCAGHDEKTCFNGSSDGYGCPWNLFPGGVFKNVNCGLCMECVRTCPYDNIALNLRPFGDDLSQTRGRRLDEAYKALILVGSAAAYAAVMLGPWSALKTAAATIGSPAWWGFVALFLTFVLGLLPGAFYLAVRTGSAFAPVQSRGRHAFVRFAYTLVPLGLAAWVSFTLSFVSANGSYLWPVLSDPMGRGWDLLGTADLSWTPHLAGFVPPVQALVLLGGLAWSAMLTRRVAAEQSPAAGASQALPVILFHLLLTLLLLWLLVG